MTVISMDVRTKFGARRPDLFGSRRMRDALADHLAEQYPVGKRKIVAKRFGLTEDEARAVCNGSASHTTLDKVWRAEGWDIVLAVFTRLIGEGVDQHLERERRRHVQRAEEIGEVVRDFRSAAASGLGGIDRERLRLAGRSGAERRHLGEGYAEEAGDD